MNVLSHADLLIVFAQLALMLCTARGLGQVARWLGQPSIVGELCAGIVLGHTVLGNLFPDLHDIVFPHNDKIKAVVEGILWLCVTLVMLTAGIAVDLRTVLNKKRAAFGASALGMALPFAFGWAIGWWSPAEFLPDPSRRGLFATFVGLAIAVSAIPVAARILFDLKALRTEIGQVILSAGLMDDLIIFISLSVVAKIQSAGSMEWTEGAKTALMVMGFYGLALWLGRKPVDLFLRWTSRATGSRARHYSTAILLALVFGVGAECIGVPVIFGAFLAGILLGESPSLEPGTRDTLTHLVMSTFAPIFFTSIFMHVDLLQTTNLALTAVVLLAAIASKTGGCFLGARAGGMDAPQSLSVGIGLNARGVVGLIVATLGLSMGVVGQAMFSALVLMSIATTAMTPPLLRRALARHPVRQIDE
jgi:Kef-type K+ transport system membrane component KefB